GTGHRGDRCAEYTGRAARGLLSGHFRLSGSAHTPETGNRTMIEQKHNTPVDASTAHEPSRRDQDRLERRRRWNRWGGWRGLLVTLIALLLITAIVYRLWPQKAAEEENETVVVSVQVAKAEYQPIATETSALGTVFPKQQATVSAKISAPIVRMEL